MKEFHEKRKIKRIIYSRLSILILIVFVGILSKASFHVYEKYKESRGNNERAKAELDKLKSRQLALVEDIARLETPYGVEKEIRTKFKMAKEGENMVIIVDKEEEEIPVIEKKSFLNYTAEKIRNWFR